MNQILVDNQVLSWKLHKGHSQVGIFQFDLIIVSLRRLSVTKITCYSDMISAQGWMSCSVKVNMLRFSFAQHVSPLRFQNRSQKT